MTSWMSPFRLQRVGNRFCSNPQNGGPRLKGFDDGARHTRYYYEASVNRGVRIDTTNHSSPCSLLLSPFLSRKGAHSMSRLLIRQYLNQLRDHGLNNPDTKSLLTSFSIGWVRKRRQR